MQIKSASFITSSSCYQQSPNKTKPEIAFIGRSNVGKSSLINMLLQRKNLAKTSKKPGKTQLINHYLVNNEFYLVDLPGYGWAQTSQKQKKQFQTLLSNYILHSQCLFTIFLLIDGKIPPQNIDLLQIEWLAEHNIPFAIVTTKADQKHRARIQKHQAHLTRILNQTWASLPPIFTFSTYDRLGLAPLLNYIGTLCKA